MSWKKGLFSYILWAVYTVAVCAGVIAAGLSFSSVAGISAGYGVLAAVVYLLAVGLLVLSVKKLINIGDFAARMEYNMSAIVVESAAVVLFLAVGLYQRLDYLAGITDIAGGAAYFEAAKVVAGQSVPQVVHGGTYLYLQFLHSAFLLFGNKAVAAFGLQLMLQVFAALLFYFAVRKYSGVFAGLTEIAFFMLSSHFVTEVAVLSPVMLILLVYSLVFGILACYMKSDSCNAFVYLLFSALVGIVVYLDIFGLTLFIFIGGFLASKRAWDSGFLRSRIGVAVFSALGGILGFLGSIAFDAYVSGKPFINVITAWGKLWIPGYNAIDMSADSFVGFGGLIVLVVLLTAGVYTFWYRKKRDTQGIWIVMTLIFSAMLIYEIQLQKEGCRMFLLLFLAILGGAGLDNLFVEEDDEPEESKPVKQEAEEDETEALPVIAKEKKRKEKKVKEKKIKENKRNEKKIKEKYDNEKTEQEKADKEKPAKRKKPAKKAQFDVIDIIAEQEAEALAHENVKEATKADGSLENASKEDASKEDASKEDIPKVRFLDNPLPLPKKHEPKVFEYRITEFDGNQDYDIEVADDDDFDI